MGVICYAAVGNYYRGGTAPANGSQRHPALHPCVLRLSPHTAKAIGLLRLRILRWEDDPALPFFSFFFSLGHAYGMRKFWGSGIKPESRQWQCWIPNPRSHQDTPSCLLCMGLKYNHEHPSKRQAEGAWTRWKRESEGRTSAETRDWKMSHVWLRRWRRCKS